MTMILGTLRRDACFLTADASHFRGPSLEPIYKQKIYPIPQSSMAVVISGFGEIGGVSIEEAMAEFYADRATRLRSMKPSDAIQTVGAHFAPAARIGLMVNQADFCGEFIVMGWGHCPCGHPHAFGLNWLRKGNTISETFISQIDVRKGPGLFLAGGGTTALQHHWNDRASMARLAEPDGFVFHDELHAEALNAQMPDARYHPHGPLHKLLITPDGWEWRQAPPSPLAEQVFRSEGAAMN